ncbi:hypothetical protein ADEAN_001024900 [Angomonas deanei]|uniref:Uncharacterized protein n=1 Tax=Angomonas deanei TaxID=59799 RepID=A0A7G2CWQ6_9TRYP|nr:hypothetical protein ADEAN_001024900 [Angomonas deanei]
MKELQQIQQRRDRRTGPRSSAQPRPSTAVRRQYDTVEPSTGNSATQLRFNQLVRDALLRFGPPLPAEFVGDNKIVTTSSSKDLGADGKSFEAVDEVKLKIYELYDVLLKHKPTFSLEEDCDGVPLSLMVKNCNYLRSHEGKVCYMRYLRREEMENGKRALVLSIGKYKMREHPSQDGVRQGPQPWLYKYGMT